MTHNNQTQKGFALLMTLLVVTAVVSITLAVIELSLKQIELTVTARDSELAFQAANAGMECVRYLHRQSSSTLSTSLPGNIPYTCFNNVADTLRDTFSSPVVTFATTGTGAVRRYGAEITWGPSGDRCSVIDMVVMRVDAAATGNYVITNLVNVFPGYTVGDKSCGPGSICTIAEVTGYNKPCNQRTSPGSVRREVLLEF